MGGKNGLSYVFPTISEKINVIPDERPCHVTE